MRLVVCPKLYSATLAMPGTCGGWLRRGKAAKNQDIKYKNRVFLRGKAITFD